MGLGLLPHTIAFIMRWQESGHVPLSNMYEYMSIMGWVAVVVLIFMQYRFKLPIIGAIISPVVFMLMVATALLPKDINQSLMPALQSIWLYIHVSLAAIGSGCFLVSYAISSIYLIRNYDPSEIHTDGNKSTLRAILLLLVAFPIVSAIVAVLAGFNPPTMNSFIGSPQSGMNFGNVFIILGLSFVAGSIIAALAVPRRTGKESGGFGGFIFSTGTLVFLISALVAGLLLKSELFGLTRSFVARTGENVNSAWMIFEFIGAAYVVSLLLSLLIFPLLRGITGKSLRLSLPRLNLLDEVSYKSVSLGYPLYTVGALFAGAVWAEQAWGQFWSWDPKEVGALIIWLFYSGYLHARYQKDWSGSKAAILAVAGFLMVVFSFFGNYFFGGLHAYA